MKTNKAKEFFKNAMQKFSDLLYPKGITCVNCGAELIADTRVDLCAKCTEGLVFNEGRRCPICGIGMHNEADYCDNCTKYDKYFDLNRSPLVYDGVGSDLIKKLKFGGKKYIAAELAKLMADEYYSENIKADVILFVPMTDKEIKERGYNQSELLACEMSARLGLPVAEKLVKTKDTDRQKKLSAKERRENLKDVFDVVGKEEIKGKNILIIDDVFTTGATVNECARVLKKAGARKVFSVTACITRFRTEGERVILPGDNALQDG